MVSVAEPGPPECGKNTTWMEQLLPGATPGPPTQLLLEMKKSLSPVTSWLFISNAAPPILLTVTVWGALSVPGNRLPKLSEAGEIDALGGFTPVPESATETGLLPASLMMVSVAEPGPRDRGANATSIKQVAPGDIPAPMGQLLLKMVKSASPLIARLLICSGPVPVSVTATLCAGLWVPTAWFPKVKADGETEAVAGLTPVPERATDTGPFEALLPMVSVAEPGPAESG